MQLKRYGFIFVVGYLVMALTNLVGIVTKNSDDDASFIRYLLNCILYSIADLLTVGMVIKISNDASR